MTDRGGASNKQSEPSVRGVEEDGKSLKHEVRR